MSDQLPPTGGAEPDPERDSAAEPDALADLEASVETAVVASNADELERVADSVVDRIASDPGIWDFFAAVRRIECEHPERPRVGSAQRRSGDFVDFAQVPSLRFEPWAIKEVETDKSEQRASSNPLMRVTFLGLLGPHGPMPLHFSEYVHDRASMHRDPTLRAFLDIFHHRVVSLFYRAWAINQPTVSTDRPSDDRFYAYTASLVGLHSKSLTNRDALDDRDKLHYAGRVAGPRCAESVREVISDYFGIDCRVEQLVGQWLPIPENGRCKLGESKATGLMGKTLTIGSMVWDVQHRFRLVLGPVCREFERFLPTGGWFDKLVAWLDHLVGLEFDWDVQLLVKKECVPQTQLGKAGHLGWTSWVLSGEAQEEGKILLRPPPIERRGSATKPLS